jgi:hypothetical protein
MNRRHLLALGAAGAGATGLSAAGLALAEPAVAALSGPVTETMVLTGTDADHPVDWEFQVTQGRRAGVWSTIATPSNWECHGFGSYH